MQAILLLALVVALVSANSQIVAPRHRNGLWYKRLVQRENEHHERIGFIPNSTKNWFTQLIDHNDPSLGTFQDKFYYDTQFWNGSGPCMFYLNGEGPLNRAVGGYMADIAKNFSACTISIEHRYYGESLPSPLTNKYLLTRTLTVDQAMRDVMALIEHFENNIIKMKPTWFLVGGSYSGGMTVWVNEKYPGKFKASWAASGVVRSTFAYTDYDGHVKAVTSRKCGDALSNVMRLAEKLWDESPASEARLRSMFNVPSYNTKTDYMWAMADASASSVQYSAKTDMCNAILPETPFESDWAVLENYAAYVNQFWGSNFLASCYYSTACMANASMSDQWGPAGYSWVYECCNEMAWWQIGYPGSIRSRNISISYFEDQCRAAFYENTTTNSWAFNKRHHGLHPQTLGNIVATQGSDDPWSTTGLHISQGPTFPVTTAQCTNCGHCGSMMSPQDSDPTPLKEQRQIVLRSLAKWLGLW